MTTCRFMEQLGSWFLWEFGGDLGKRAVWAEVTHPLVAPDATEQQWEHKQSRDECKEV